MLCETSHVDSAGNARIVEDAASDWKGYELFNQSSPPTKIFAEEDETTLDPLLAELGSTKLRTERLVRTSNPMIRRDENLPKIILDTFVSYCASKKAISVFVGTIRQMLNWSQYSNELCQFVLLVSYFTF